MAVLYRQVMETSEKNCAKDASSMIADVCADLEARLAWMDSTASKFLLDSQVTGIAYAEALQYADPRVKIFTTFSKHLNNLIGIYPDSDYGYHFLFQDNELVFHNTGMSQGLAFYFNSSLQYDSMDYDAWYAAVFGGNGKAIFPADDIHLTAGRIRALTYNYPIMRRSAQGNRKAVLQFYIPESKLIPRNFNAQASGFLLSAQGNVLSNFGAQQPLPVDAREILNKTGFIRTRAGLTVYDSVSSGLTMALFFPNAVAFEDAIALRSPLIITFLFIAVAEGLLTWYFSRRNARPIEGIASNIGSMLNTTPKGNEWDYVHQGIMQIKQERTDEKERSRNAEIALLLYRLAHYRVDSQQDILREGDRLGINLRADGYLAAVALLPETSISAAVPEMRALPGSLRVLCSKGSWRQIHFLYLLDDEEQEEAAINHLQAILPLLPQGTRIGVGQPCAAVNDVFLSYHQAVYCLQSEETADGLTRYDRMTPGENSLCFPPEEQQQILNAVRSGSEKSIEEAFDTLLKENTVERHLTALLKHTLIASVEALLVTAAEGIAPQESLSDYLHSIRRSDDFREQLDVLKGEFIKLAKRSQALYSNSDKRMKAEILAYLNQHYSDAGLSVSAMASDFGFSESYFSVLFKELMGETYSACLERMRLNRARELLKTGSMSIEDISSQVGYGNSTSFRRAFKRAEGLSPQQYREQG